MTQATTQPAPIAVPRTEAQLTAVQLQRSELIAQLEQLSEQRQQLVNERHNAMVNQNPAVVTELDGRIRALSERIVRIERTKLAADDAIAQGIAQGIAREGGGEGTPAPSTAPENFAFNLLNQGMMQQQLATLEQNIRNDYQRKMVFGGAGLLLLGVLVWRWALIRASARLRKEFAAAGPGGNTRELKDAVDAIALEVERISENQRFVTKLLSDKEPQAIAAKRSDASPR